MSIVEETLDLDALAGLGSGGSARLLCDHPSPGSWTVQEVSVQAVRIGGEVTFVSDFGTTVLLVGFELYIGMDLYQRYRANGHPIYLTSGDATTVRWGRFAGPSSRNDWYPV